MKNLAEVLTPEQKESFKNWYVLRDNEMTKMTDIDYDQPTAENFKVLCVDDEYKVAAIEDIEFYDPEDDDFDFSIGDEGDYFVRGDTPKEVVEFLDRYLNKSQYE